MKYNLTGSSGMTDERRLFHLRIFESAEMSSCSSVGWVKGKWKSIILITQAHWNSLKAHNSPASRHPGETTPLDWHCLVQ